MKPLCPELTTDGFRTTVIEDGYSVLGVPPALAPDVVILDIANGLMRRGVRRNSWTIRS